MNINHYSNQNFTSKKINFPTNGVLRCLTGEVPDGKTEKDLENAKDIWVTIKNNFGMKDKDLIDIKASKDPLAPYLLVLGAGKDLETKNPQLNKIRQQLMDSKSGNNLDCEINNLVEHLGKTINLFV